MLDPSVGCKVEGSSLQERAFVEVTIEADQFIFGRVSERHDLAIRINNARARHQVVTVFVASLAAPTTQQAFWYAPACMQRWLWCIRVSAVSLSFNEFKVGVL